MEAMKKDYCDIVTKSLTGEDAKEEQTAEAILALHERLEKLQSLGGKFAEVGFSPEAMALFSKTAQPAMC